MFQYGQASAPAAKRYVGWKKEEQCLRSQRTSLLSSERALSDRRCNNSTAVTRPSAQNWRSPVIAFMKRRNSLLYLLFSDFYVRNYLGQCPAIYLLGGCSHNEYNITRKSEVRTVRDSASIAASITILLLSLYFEYQNFNSILPGETHVIFYSPDRLSNLLRVCGSLVRRLVFSL